MLRLSSLYLRKMISIGNVNLQQVMKIIIHGNHVNKYIIVCVFLFHNFLNTCESFQQKLCHVVFQDLQLLLLSHFSPIRLCATPQTAAHQASPSLGFSRQEHWSGLPFPSSGDLPEPRSPAGQADSLLLSDHWSNQFW